MRAHRVILDQGARSEIALLDRDEPFFAGIPGDAERRHALDRARNVIASGIALGEPRARPRQLQIDEQARRQHVVVGPFDAAALARAAGFRGAGITGEEQFGVEPQFPKGERTLKVRNDLGAHTDLGALGLHQRRHRISRQPGLRIDPDRGAAGIVAVKTTAEVGEVLGLRPGAENQVQLGREHVVAHLARVDRKTRIDVEPVVVGADARDAAEPAQPLGGVFGVDPQAALANLVVAGGRKTVLSNRAEQRDLIDIVEAALQADAVQHVERADLADEGHARMNAIDGAPVGLLELVALHRVVEKIGEVGKQVEAVADGIGIDLVAATVEVGIARRGQRIARRASAVGGVEGTEARDIAAIDGPLPDLVGGVPLAVVAHQRHVESIGLGSLRQFQHPVELLVTIRMVPRAIVADRLEGIQQVSVTDIGAAGDQRALVVEVAQGQGGVVGGQRIGVAQPHRAGRGEIAVLGKVRPLAVIDARDQFRYQERQVGIALAMRMGRHVDRHAGEIDGKVGTVIQVEPAQEILVGLAVAAMLRDDHARHEFEHFAGPQHRPGLDAFGSHAALAGCVGAADSGVVMAEHVDSGSIEFVADGHARHQPAGACPCEQAGYPSISPHCASPGHGSRANTLSSQRWSHRSPN